MKLVSLMRVTETAFLIWRLYHMYKHTKNVVKGISAGVVAAGAIAAIGTQVAKHKKKPGKNFRRQAGKAVHTVSALMGDVEKMLR